MRPVYLRAEKLHSFFIPEETYTEADPLLLGAVGEEFPKSPRTSQNRIDPGEGSTHRGDLFKARSGAFGRAWGPMDTGR